MRWSGQAPLGGVALQPHVHRGLHGEHLAAHARPAVPAPLDGLVEAGVVVTAEQVAVPLDAAVGIDRSGQLRGIRLGEHVCLLPFPRVDTFTNRPPPDEFHRLPLAPPRAARLLATPLAVKPFGLDRKACAGAIWQCVMQGVNPPSRAPFSAPLPKMFRRSSRLLPRDISIFCAQTLLGCMLFYPSGGRAEEPLTTRLEGLATAAESEARGDHQAAAAAARAALAGPSPRPESGRARLALGAALA